MHTADKYLPTRTYYKNCFFIIILLTAIYLLDNSSIPSLIGEVTFTYVMKPLLWVITSLIIFKMKRIRSVAKLKYIRFLYSWAFYFGLFYVLMTVFAGLFDGLGKSPYSHNLKGVITNLAYVGSALVGRELIRSYLINSVAKKENYLVFVLIALLMTITYFPVSKYVGLKGLQGVVKFVAEYFAPEFSHNLFATYLVYLGGPWVSIIYFGTILGFHWFSPVLPALSWIITALIGILCPVFFLMIFKSIYLQRTKESNERQQEKEGLFSWVITCLISICIIWFAVGVFPIYPSVIATGSMEPMIKPGDIILVDKITDVEEINNLKINDVIQFKRDGILISHRIIEIKDDDEEGLQFKTKGDNNSVSDPNLVKPQDVKGTIKYIVPKIGWLTLLMKSKDEISLDDVVF